MTTDLSDLPVVILSSPCHPSDMAKARELGARNYVVKPHGLSQLCQFLQELNARWLAMASTCL
jgi:DNA-binding response OmpR family regulator